MERIEYRNVDKSTWSAGPWMDEPDKLQWPDKSTGLPCLIVRGPLGALCGYVGVPSGHPLYCMKHSDVDAAVDRNVHGGLTFSGACSDGPEDHAICHRPAPGEADHVWWFGFDCAHFGDLVPDPRLGQLGRSQDDIYRTVDYVTENCAKLAQALAACAR